MKIGLMLPLAQGETDGWTTLRAMALAAEEHGLDSVWGADHLIFRSDGETEGIHECWTLLTAVAAITSRVEIGPLVLALPFRNPALTAKMAIELDEISDGRLVLGVGCGWHQPEFDAFDYPFDHRVSRFAEGLEILMPMLRGESVTWWGTAVGIWDGLASIVSNPMFLKRSGERRANEDRRSEGERRVRGERRRGPLGMRGDRRSKTDRRAGERRSGEDRRASGA